ncbi:MAG: arsenate reductase ArsC [Spirochaetales bacterium]|nr:arsenate reductase ArsC [Spirochaetales bacterium]
MTKKKVIFICIHNSARSQMAEAWLKHLAGDKYEVYSAGLEPGKLNPTVVQAMSLEGIDISKNETNSVNEFIDGHIKFDYVITVCDETSAEKCPFFPGQVNRLHWGFKDPSAIPGNSDNKLKETIIIRNKIKDRIEQFLKL